MTDKPQAIEPSEMAFASLNEEQLRFNVKTLMSRIAQLSSYSEQLERELSDAKAEIESPSGSDERVCQHKSEPMNASAWFADAKARVERGEKTRQCPVCKSYVLEGEYLTEPQREVKLSENVETPQALRNAAKNALAKHATSMGELKRRIAELERERDEAQQAYLNNLSVLMKKAEEFLSLEKERDELRELAREAIAEPLTTYGRWQDWVERAKELTK